MDIMRTHPMVIIGGILQENPFFVPPDEIPTRTAAAQAAQGGRFTGITHRTCAPSSHGPGM